MEDLRHQKRALRAETLLKRDALSPSERAAREARILRNLMEQDAYRTAGTVAVFVSCRSEVDTRAVIEDLLKKGRTVAVPRVVSRGEMEFCGITDPDRDLQEGTFGIREPKPSAGRVRPGDIDLMIAPGAAFDARGFRIGYGGGYYDRYIRKLRPDCPVISPAFEVQIVDRVPAGPFDEAVDAIITEERVIEPR